MRNLKKFLALVLAFMMAMSLMVTVNAKNVEFANDGDKINAAFADDITVLAGMGVAKGVTKDEFQPTAGVTRAEMAAIVYRLVTGDANDDLAYAYARNDEFTDVAADKWYAGYVGYCANAGIIKGYGDGRFGPSNPVTGYEALVMLLRGMGYDQPTEFSGSDWRQKAASYATTRGLLVNVDKTTYKNTLSQNANREFVFELAFQAATHAMVQYTPAFGYQTTGMTGGLLNTVTNPTLGEKYYGLTSRTGVVVGNQATGEKNTLVSVGLDAVYNIANDTVVTVVPNSNGSYEYATDAVPATAAAPVTNVTLAYSVDTGLSEFAHLVEVWYDNGSARGSETVEGERFGTNYGTTYAVLDRAESSEAFYADDNADVGDVAGIAAAKKSTTSVLWSDRYSQIGTLTGDDSTNLSPISTYRKVVNPSGTVYIALSAEVAEITQKNTTAKDPYLILGSDTPNVSTFGDGTTAGTILLSQLTAESVQKLGELVTAYEVVGTAEDSNSIDRTLSDVDGVEGDSLADCKYQLEEMKTFTATVNSYKVLTSADGGPLAIDNAGDVVISVNLAGHDEMLLSGITMGDGSNSEIISEALPVINKGDLVANATYTVYEDIVGRFISLYTGDDYKFLYGTYADFEVGALGTGTIVYNMVGVNWEAQKLGENTLKSFNGNTMNGNEYNTNISTVRKDYGDSTGSQIGNQLTPGYYTGYLYNATTGDLKPSDAKRMDDGAVWSITSGDASNGFKKVNNPIGDYDYLLTKDTHFIVVSGTGTATLKVEEYKGLADFLQGAAEALISYNAGMNEVIFKTEAEKYGTVDTENNGVITDIILSVGNLNRWNSTSMFFNYDQTTDTGMVLPGMPNVKQYELWSDGEVGYYFVDTNAVGGTAPETAMTFYNLVKIGEKSGVPYYKAVEAPENNGQGNLAGIGYASDSITYEYITVSTLDTGLFSDDGGSTGKVFSIADAKVCDVEFKTGASTGRNEITTQRELNNAVSVRQSDGTTVNYSIGVAIVYSGINVSCIYVTSVTAAP